jgi:2-polyprenyl-6-methoxyphenol hydroxylase-like FAD-dependent oxidoreductase
MTQVVIVGAGPAGATLALLFAKRGIAVKLIESSRNFRRVFRGEGLMPSGLDALEQMGLSSVLESIPPSTLGCLGSPDRESVSVSS